MILILTGGDDVHADVVIEKLEERGVAYRRWDDGSFPLTTRLTMERTEAGPRWSAHCESGELDLSLTRAVWNRRPSRPVAAPSVTDAFMREYVALECSIVLEDLWASLDCPWIPARRGDMRRADLKFAQLRAATEAGYEVPATLISNDPEEVLAFREAQGEKIISKLPGPALFRQAKLVANRYTQRVTRADLGYVDAVEYAPILVQPYIEKALEIRATVVGDRVFAAEIHSQTSRYSATDWRRYDLRNTPHAVHALPASEIERAIALTRRLGLSFGAIDLILTPEGRYVFLEINPNGQYLWIEDLTGLPISEAMCDLLILRAKAHDETN